MKRWRRKRVTVDPRIQGRLCLRICAYWVICFLSIAFLLACSAMLSESGMSAELWTSYGKVASLSFLALPLALLDGLIFSNRFCGPVRRITRGLNDLASGNEAQQINLRPGDFYFEVAEEFNRVVARMQELEAGSRSPGVGIVEAKEESTVAEEELAIA